MRILLLSNAFNAACSMLVSWLIAYSLDVESFSAVAYAIYLANVAVVLIDVGIPLTLIKLYNQYEQDDAFLAVGARLRLMLSILAVAVAMFLPMGCYRLAGFPVGQEALGRCALIAGASIGLCFISRTIFQAKQDWRGMAYTTASYGGLRVVGVLVALWLELDLEYLVLMTLALPSLVVALSSLYVHDLLFPVELRVSFQTTRLIFRYAIWVGLGGVIFRCQNMVAMWYSSTYLPSSQTGLIMLSASFVGAAGIVMTTLRSILVSKATNIKTLGDLVAYKKMAVTQIFRLLAISAVAITAACIFVDFVFGDKFSGVAPVLVTASLGVVVPGAIGYFSVLIHGVGRPQDEFMIGVTRLSTLALIIYVVSPQTVLLALALQVLVSVFFELIQGVRAYRLQWKTLMSMDDIMV